MTNSKGKTCPACDEQIHFKQTNKGAWMPVNPGLVSGRDHKTLLIDGQVVKNPTANEQGFVPHFATCTKPELFRRNVT